MQLRAAKVIRLIGQALHSSGASGFRKFSSNKKFTLSDRLQKAWCSSEKNFKKVKVVFSMIGLPQRVLTVGIGPLLYGFMIDRAWEEAALVHILYLHKQMRSLNSHSTGYEYLKDGLIIYMDISSCDLAVHFSNKNNNYYSIIIRR